MCCCPAAHRLLGALPSSLVLGLCEQWPLCEAESLCGRRGKAMGSCPLFCSPVLTPLQCGSEGSEGWYVAKVTQGASGAPLAVGGGQRHLASGTHSG